MATPGISIDFKKGEVNELKMMLRNPTIDRDPGKKKEILKKVVALMTMGVDMSELFADIIMCSKTTEIVQKKLIYLYITQYAHADGNQDTALLAVNTLQKDCRDNDPMIRGLALRSLCSLRVRNLMEYSMQSVKLGLTDPNAYVRRTAVIGLLKMFHISPRAVNTQEHVAKLMELVGDRDAHVAVNAIRVLDEMHSPEGFRPTKTIVFHILNRLKDFDEWSLCTVMDMVSKFLPQEEEVVFDIMNLLEDLFRNSNSGLVLAVAKVFLNLTQTMPNVHEQVLVRLKTPLITLMTAGSPETTYACLCHLRLLIQRAPKIFANDYKHFYCRGNDPTYTKTLKVDVLVDMVSSASMFDIVSELSEYATDVDAELARHSIRAIGRVGCTSDQALQKALHTLRTFLSLQIEYVSAECIATLGDLLRKHPEVSDVVGDCVEAGVSIDEEPAKIALLWMLGEFGENVSESPYLLEAEIDNYDDHSPAVKHALLNASMKLFFKRPGEMQPPLGSLLTQATQDTTNVDVHDRALFFARLLQFDVNEAKRVCGTTRGALTSFTEDNSLELQDRLFEEFNTLSILYGEPSEFWMRSVKNDDELSDSDQQQPTTTHANNRQHAQTESNSNMMIPANGLDDPTNYQQLDADAVLQPAEFENYWGTVEHETQVSGTLQRSLPEASIVSNMLKDRRITTVAFGDLNGVTKFFLYAKLLSADEFVLVEWVVPSSGHHSATIKSADFDACHIFSQLFVSFVDALF